MLIEQLNQVGNTWNIKLTLTFDEEQNGSISFLGTKLIWKEEGMVKVEIYRKNTHTNQYLSFSSHHPVHYKLEVVFTLLDWSDSLVTEEEDRNISRDCKTSSATF